MRVGFVGLGTMGGAMAANVARAGFAVTAWNRTAGRAAELAGLGVRLAASPAAVAAASEVIVTVVSDTPDVEAVLFGDLGVAAGAPAGHPRRRHVDDRAIRHAGLRRPARERRRRDAGRAGVGRQRGREEGHPLDLRRRRGRRPRARPSGARLDGHHHHPRWPDRRRPGREGREPGDPRRRPTSASRRGSSSRSRPAWTSSRSSPPCRVALPSHGSSRTGAAGCSPTTTRSGSRSPSTGRTSGSPCSSPVRRAPRCRSRRSCEQIEAGLIGKGHGDDDVSAVARAIRELSGLDG